VDLIVPSSAGQTFLFYANGDRVTFRNITVNGSTLTGNLSGSNRYIFCAFGTSKAAPKRRARVINCRIENVDQDDGNTPLTNLSVWHGVYFQYTSRSSIDGLEVTSLSGNACYLIGNDKLSIKNCSFGPTGWGGVSLHSDNSVYEVAYNDFYGTTAGSRFFAAGIDDMSQCSPYSPPNINGHMHHNYFTGVYSYGSVIRIAGSHVTCHNNIYNQCVVSNAHSASHANNVIFVLTRATGPVVFTANTQSGSAVLSNISGAANLTAGHSYVTDFPTAGVATEIISVGSGTATLAAPATTTATGATFGFASYQEAPSQVDIHDETIIAGGLSQRGVTISGRATFGTGDDNSPLTDIRVHDNTMVSVDADNYLSMALYTNGQGSGIIDATFDQNKASIHPETTASPGTGNPVAGAVGILGSASAPTERFRARNNTLTYFDVGDGPATTSVQAGVYLHAHTSGSEVRGNTLVGFYDAIFGALNSGSHHGLYHNLGISSVRGNLLLESGVTVAADVQSDVATSVVTDRTQAGPYMTFGANSLIVSPRTTTQKSMVWRKIASLGTDMVAWEDVNGTAIFLRVNGNGFLINKKTAAPVDGELLASEMAWWLKTTVGAAGPQFKVKDSAGTVYSFDFSRGAALADTSGANLAALEAEVNALKARLRTAGLLAP
jgi:hypothetical protein